MPSSPWILVCPGNRGIGHALTRRLLRTTPLPILATTRRGSLDDFKASLLAGTDDKAALARRLHVVHCDFTSEFSLADAAHRAETLFPPSAHHLHLACAIPGILRAEKSLAQVDPAESMESFRINTLGPLLLAKYFSQLLPRRATSSDAALGPLPAHAIWLNMAARVGSTTDNRAGNWFSYKASKAAVFSLTRSLDVYFSVRSGDAALAVAYHPGTVQTELSKDFWHSVLGEKLFSVEYAAEKMVDVICGLQTSQRGRCWDWKGEEVPPCVGAKE